MEKIELEAKPFLFLKPVTLIGANVNGKPNFMALAYCNIVNQKPPIIAISSGKRQHTNIGIKENGTFSVNTPSEVMIEIVDYCGLVSGRRVDKSTLLRPSLVSSKLLQ
ncbi:MAG: flavin reductase family protein [Promethearchaeota archaeon]